MKTLTTHSKTSFTSFWKIIAVQIVVLLLSTNLFADNDIEVTGSITELGEDYLVVNGYTFYVDENTEFEGDDDGLFTFASLNVGNIVEVEGASRGDGTYLAEEVELEDGPFGDDEFEITGYVEILDSNSFGISGYTFNVDANTRFDARHGLSFSFAQVEVGMLLEVKAEVMPNGSLLAVRVKREDDHNHHNEVEVTAVIDSITTNSIILGSWEFFVNEQTIIMDRNKNLLSFSDLNVGDRVEVKAYKQLDNTYLAVRIKFEDDHENEIEFTGQIENIEGTNIAVAGITFATDSNTVFLNHSRMPVTIGAFSVGMLVEIKGFKLNDGSYYAVRVKIEDFFNDEVEVRGNITELTDAYLVVNNIQFDVDSLTQVFDHSNIPIPYSSLTLGQLVEVKGRKTGTGTVSAVRIKIEDKNDITIFGRITAINADNFELNGLTVFVNNNTLFLNHNNQPISYSDLSIDLLVEVKLIHTPNNILTAIKVKIEDGSNFSKLIGSIGSVSGIGIQVAQTNYKINSETVILDKDFNKITVSQLDNGEQVTIWSHSNPSGRAALQIQSNISGVTSVSDNGIVANDFQIEQNYPNPFNPSTTISFNLLSEQVVSLKVFNAIGQEVATLINSKLASGSYNINFNAAGLSSGLYLYRLESGTKVQVKKMMLLK
jgi:hypothetical protein